MTKTDICNMALSAIGEDKISNIEEDTTEQAKACRLFFDQARDVVTRSYRWKCCKSRAELNQDTVKPAFEWDYQYRLPQDCVRVLHMDFKDRKFIVEGRFLLTNETTAKIVYLKRIVNFGEADPYFIEALYHDLGIRVVMDLRGANGEKIRDGLIKKMMEEILPTARAVDSMEKNTPDHRKVHDGFWLQSRQSGSHLLTLTRPENLV